jgi:very-short-patch-repair endonuclease
VRPSAAGNPAFEQRLLRFYLSCVEAEQAGAVRFSPAGRGQGWELRDRGPEQLCTGVEAALQVRSDDPTFTWLQRRLAAGATETVLAGWPVVVGPSPGPDPGDSGRRAAVECSPLFLTPVSVHRIDDDTLEVHADAAVPECNIYALDLLGLDRGEREALLAQVAERAGAPRSAVELVRSWLDTLVEHGLIEPDVVLDPAHLGPLPVVSAATGPVLANSGMFWVGERSRMTWHLLTELEQLAGRSPDELRAGPLGILLGAREAPSPRPADPQPVVVPTNLAQDGAITNALTGELTVVTGPPGTGKSQVLVNTVAAALARGESVLFASRNNRAVDVVFERLAATSARAVPVRAGSAGQRADVAATIRAALARPAPNRRSGRGAARDAWERLADELRPLYAAEAGRRELEEAIRAADADLDRLLGSAPVAARRLAMECDGEASSERLEEWLDDLGALRADLDRVAGPRPWWPPARRRWERTRELIDACWGELRNEVAVLELDPHPDHDAIDRARRLVAAAAEVVTARRRLEDAQRRLADLGERWEIEERLGDRAGERIAAGRALFEATWGALAQAAPVEARRAASELADGLLALSSEGRRRSVRSVLALLPETLRAFPVWGVTNLSAGGNFPLQRDLFDLVVIDEASQCDVASALPLLYRARRALIIGDPHQLTHITSLHTVTESRLAEAAGLDDETSRRFSYRSRSLFTLAADRLPGEPLFLDLHYRSRPAIITFANDHFYGSRLFVCTEEPRDAGPAVEWVDVTGGFRRGPGGRSGWNPEEVGAVVGELRRLHHERGVRSRDIGVVTPFRAQAEAIRQRVATMLPELAEGLVVATAHRFQGDERDVMVMSPVVSAAMPERLVSFAADPNLVNVAVTRPRRLLVVVGDRDACLATHGVLGHLARYIGDLSSGSFASPLERIVYDALVEAGLPVAVGVAVTGRRVDLAVEVGGVRLAVECDGAAFHCDERERAVRDRELERAGWRVLHLTGREIHRNPRACVERVRDALR